MADPKPLLPIDELRKQVELAELQARLLDAKLRQAVGAQEMAALKAARPAA